MELLQYLNGMECIMDKHVYIMCTFGTQFVYVHLVLCAHKHLGTDQADNENFAYSVKWRR